jgi:predicted ATPase
MKGDAAALSVSLKGVRHRIDDVSELVQAGTATQRFTGRDAEMRLLSEAFREVKRGGCKVVVVSGDPGIGKSRLLSEFAVYVTLEGGTPILTTAHPHDTGMPLTVIRNIDKVLMNQPGALGCSPTSLQWVRRLMNPDGRETSLSAEATSAAISSAVIDLINAVSGETPLVLLVDDAQWADSATLEVLQSVALSSATKHVLIVLGARQTERILDLGYWGARFVSVDLAPLDADSTIAVLADQLGEGDAEHRALIEWMADIAGGNPFFLETVVAHFRSTRERFSVPRELNAVVDQRIAALSADARDVLEAIVALGRHATVTRLEQVMDGLGPMLVRATRELEQRRLISTSDRLLPAHWLIAESIEQHSSPISRRLLHRRIAHILEREVAATSDSSAFLDCAEAWAISGETARAAELIVSCAERCVTIGRSREAASLYLRAASLAADERRGELAAAAVRWAQRSAESSLILQAA